MALLIKPPGTLETIAPKNGKAFTLEELQGFVGGYIEAFRYGEKIMWLNEDGKRLELQPNWYATALAFGHGLIPGDVIVGDVVLATMEESGESDNVEDHELLEEK